MSNFLIFDTSVFVDQLRTDRHRDRIDSLAGLIRTSSVVLAELWRGAHTLAERELLRKLAQNHPVWTPTEHNWIESGQLLSRIAADRKLSAGQLRDLHFDVLIALTARSHGARVITSNRVDFELIRDYRKFELEIW
jgi:predicted nucleic acid-binding protein